MRRNWRPPTREGCARNSPREGRDRELRLSASQRSLNLPPPVGGRDAIYATFVGFL